jgi:hypothetical protein
MIPFLFVNQLVSAMSGTTSQPETRNEDYTHYLCNAPAKARESLPWRLLPQVLRAPVKARLAARRHDESLINMWEISPHLLKDIGVVLSNGAILPDHLGPAPARVIKHVAAVDPSQIVQAELEFPPHVEQASQELATQVRKVEPEPLQMANKPTRAKPTRRATLAQLPVGTFS